MDNRKLSLDVERLKEVVKTAVGGGHLLLVGPPGSGKTILARKIAALLPPLSHPEHVECALIWSHCMGLARHGSPSFDDLKAGKRPFRAPHHTVSAQCLSGVVASDSIWSNPRKGLCPGEMSLAHAGILFLDDLEEFNRSALDRLIEPLKTGQITFGSKNGTYILPAKFTLIASISNVEQYERYVPERVKQALSTVCTMPEPASGSFHLGAVSQLCNEIDQKGKIQ